MTSTITAWNEGRRRHSDEITVTRRLDRPPATLAPAPPSGWGCPPEGDLELGGFRLVACNDLPEWTATGHLNVPSRLIRRREGVRVTIAPWSHRSCEIRIVPASRFVHLWGARRARRYFDAAHAAADHLYTAMSIQPVEPPTTVDQHDGLAAGAAPVRVGTRTTPETLIDARRWRASA